MIKQIRSMKKRIKDDVNVHLRSVVTCLHTHTYTHIYNARERLNKVKDLDMNGEIGNER